MEALVNQLASLCRATVFYSFVAFSLLANSICFAVEVAMQPDYYIGATEYQRHSCIERENRIRTYVSSHFKDTFLQIYGASSP